MATEILRPSSFTQEDATVQNGANVYDGSLSSYAFLTNSMAGAQAAERVKDFNADSYPDGRTAITLKLRGEWRTADANDIARAFFRKNSSSAWELLYSYDPSGVQFPLGSPQTRSFDITAIAGDEPATNWQVEMIYFNGPGTCNPPDPA